MRTGILLILCFVSFAVCAQGQYNVLEWKSDQTVNTFLLQKMHQQYDERQRVLNESLKSAAATLAYRDSCRIRYRRLIGSLPEKRRLNAIVTGKIQQQGYRIEKIILESIPNHHVTANLYVPAGKGPFPGVMLLCGHEDEAKATESYQRTAMLFARNGFVVFVIDPNSQAERHQLTDTNGKPLTRGGTTEHTLINAAANLVSSGNVAYQLYDNIRGLDYLMSRSEVDKEKIGCLGNSGGGTQTTYLIGYDERIKVAAICSFLASRERNFELTGANDGCQHIPFEGREGLEIGDFPIMFAPKPLLILAGKYDFVDYTGTQNAHNELRQVYQSMGNPQGIRLFTVEDGHGISQPKREAAVSWFRKWLLNDDRTIIEQNVSVLPKQELACTTTGQINSTYSNEINDFMRVRVHADSFKSKRSSANIQDKIGQVLNIRNNPGALRIERRGTAETNHLEIQKIIIRKENEIPLPVLMVSPTNAKGVVVWLHSKGKRIIADSLVLLKKFQSEHSVIIMADVSGVGELADPLIANDPKYFNREYRNAMLALHSGISLTTLRVNDIGNLMEFIATSDFANLPIALYAEGVCALPALHAAVLNSRISEVHLYDTMDSFYEIIDNPTRKDSYSSVIPAVLNYYDIQDIKNYLGNRLKK